MDYAEYKRIPRNSKAKAGKSYGPAIIFTGNKCPVSAGTPISVWHYQPPIGNMPADGWWCPVNRPEDLDWSKIPAYRLRYPRGAGAQAQPDFPQVPIPQSVDHAKAMIAVAEEWLVRNG